VYSVMFIYLFYPKEDRINSASGSMFGDANRLRFDSGFGLNSSLSPLLRYGENSGDSMHAEPHFGTSCHYQIFF